MTDTDTTAQGQSENLTALRMVELREIAAGKGIRGISGMRKHELISAIRGRTPAAAEAPRKEENPVIQEKQPEPEKVQKAPEQEKSVQEDKPAQGVADQEDNGDQDGYQSRSQARRARRNRNRGRDNQQDGQQQEKQENQQQSSAKAEGQQQENRNRNRNQGGQQGGQGNQGNQNQQKNQGNRNQDNRGPGDDNDGDGRNRRNRRNRRDRRGRDGGGNQQQSGGGAEDVRDGDVLQPVAGILDVLDNSSAFLRTSGYLPGSNDVYVSAQTVRKYGLRKGDAIVGQVRMPRDGNQSGQVTHGGGRNKKKYNPLVQVERINGLEPEASRQRKSFGKLTPLYPNERLRLETDPKVLTTRVIDLIMPIGKGQRALIVSPPKAGKTTIMQNIANAIATNNPECHLMVVLVDERPEEVTDMQRSVRGEVIASTFDRPPSDHTVVAELAIERAKRLVEQGKDVVVLLDSITRLGRAYNNSSPASGRILSGGVDSNALYPPKRFLGAARNIEEGGSLTIIATAMVETGSAGDTVIFEEFKGTGNAELKLDRRISERRVFPAVDVNPSGTRREDLLMGPEEARVMVKLRRVLSALDSQAAIDLLIKQLKKTKNNVEFMTQIASSAPMAADVDVDEML